MKTLKDLVKGKSFVVVLSLFVVALVAVAVVVKGPQKLQSMTMASHGGGGGGGGGGTLQQVNLNVVVNDTDPNSNPYNITSDGQGTYYNGQQGVVAFFGSNDGGLFHFDISQSSKGYIVPTRWVNVNCGQPLTSGAPNSCPLQSNPDWHLATTGVTIPLQNLGINGNPSTECIGLGGGWHDATYGYGYTFEKAPSNPPSFNTAYALVTRTSISPAVWTVTSVDNCNSDSGVAGVNNCPPGSSCTFMGDYNMPFMMTLTQQ